LLKLEKYSRGARRNNKNAFISKVTSLKKIQFLNQPIKNPSMGNPHSNPQKSNQTNQKTIPGIHKKISRKFKVNYF
jgi:hypothetical protein